MKPTRAEIKHAVYYAVATISKRSIADLEEGMKLGGRPPTNVGMDQIAIDAVAGLLNIWIEHRDGEGRFRAGELTPKTTLGETITATEGKF
ncbi:MAG TPA: hypothetical protein VF626_05825 [Chthoniobacterales bacterium]